MVSRDTYKELSAKATDETIYITAPHTIMEDQSVQAIVAIGLDALPFLFQDLIDNGCHGCDWKRGAINEILAKNNLPSVIIPEKSRGVVKEMVHAYIQYGHHYNYVK